MKLTFENKTALVTGAGRGIGKAIAESLAAEGIFVICLSRSESSCGAVAEAINASGGKAKAIAVDVANAEAVQAACAELLKEFGNIDIIVNNAGITKDNLALRMSTEDWNAVVDTNLSSCFHIVKGLLRPMTKKRSGRIINITSVSGISGNAGQLNYSAAKAGMIGFTKSLAKEIGSRSITVNAVAPGFTKTDMTAKLGDDMLKEVEKHVALKRLGEPEDIANMVTFLCSDQASYVTGQVFTVDGGLAI